MGLLDRFRRGLTGQAPNGVPVYYRQYEDTWATEFVAGMTVEELWRTQPYLRTVVTFLARNIAQLGLHTFRRVDEDDRQRDRESPLAKLLRRPNPTETTYELVFALVGDLALYDEAYWWIGQDPEAPAGWVIQRIPPTWISERGGGSLFAPAWYDILPPGGQKAVRVKADNLLVFRGWNPDSFATGSSPVAALKQVLAEQIHAHRFRQQVWERGGRVGTVITRPAGVDWSNTARDRFREDWRNRWAGEGADAGGTPILEDGMTLNRVGFSAHEEEWVEAAKLSLSIVASTYHVNPTMVGLLDNANYSNVREFRRMLYGDTLGPIMAMIEARINAFLAPRIGADPDLYVEFNINEKLQGSFEEQVLALQSAVGRPWMTADEARALLNMRGMGGEAAELITPLNVAIGGQASPTDSGEQNLGPEIGASSMSDPDAAMQMFLQRQARVVKSRLGAKADGWWEADRWNRELAHDLRCTPAAAALINEDTKQRLDQALTTTDPAGGVARVFEDQERRWRAALTPQKG